MHLMEWYDTLSQDTSLQNVQNDFGTISQQLVHKVNFVMKGMSWQTTKPHLRTFTGVLRVYISFSHASWATGSFLMPHSTYLEVNGFELISSVANVSKFLVLSTFRSNFEAVSLNFHSSFHHCDWNWPLMLDSVLLITVSSTARKLIRALSGSSSLSRHTKSPVGTNGNLG